MALHLIAISGDWLRAPPPVPQPVPLEARIASAPPPLAPPAPPRFRPAPRAKPAARAPRPIALPPAPEPVPHTVPFEPEAADSEAAVAETPAAPPEPEPPPADIAEATAERAQPPVKTLPKKGRITYALYLGSDRFNVGRTVQTWELDDLNYRLGSISETTGVVELFGSRRLVYLSRGRLTAHGLQPESFLMSRTRRGRTEEARARLDRDTKTITFGRTGAEQSAALAENTQDIVSFMYQLALAPPVPGRVALPITNGYRYETHQIDVLAEETIDTPLGPLRALPIRQVRKPGTESIAIWLAVEYRYLPVRLRFFDRDGNPTGEQVVSEITISEE